MGTPWALCLLSRWPSPWRWLMITLLSVHTEGKCGSKGMEAWTVPRQGGALLGSIRLGPHPSLLGHQTPSPSFRLTGPVTMDRTSALFIWCQHKGDSRDPEGTGGTFAHPRGLQIASEGSLSLCLLT